MKNKFVFSHRTPKLVRENYFIFPYLTGRLVLNTCYLFIFYPSVIVKENQTKETNKIKDKKTSKPQDLYFSLLH